MGVSTSQLQILDFRLKINSKRPVLNLKSRICNLKFLPRPRLPRLCS